MVAEISPISLAQVTGHDFQGRDHGAAVQFVVGGFGEGDLSFCECAPGFGGTGLRRVFGLDCLGGAPFRAAFAHDQPRDEAEAQHEDDRERSGT